MTELKNPVARWAFDELKRRAAEQFPDPEELLSRLTTDQKKNLILDGDLAGMLQRLDDSSFQAIAQALEVAGRLELVARRYDLGDLPSVDDGVSFATHASAMMADPVRVDALTAAVNEVCSCGGGPPGECCQACEVYHILRTRATDEADQEGAPGDG
jgi:hypothetical protein